MKTNKISAVIVAAALALPSCVTMSRYKGDLARQKAEDEAKYNATVAQVVSVVANLRERLVRFNQLDENGNLRPLKAEKPAAAKPAPAAPAAVDPKSIFAPTPAAPAK